MSGEAMPGGPTAGGTADGTDEGLAPGGMAGEGGATDRP